MRAHRTEPIFRYVQQLAAEHSIATRQVVADPSGTPVRFAAAAAALAACVPPIAGLLVGARPEALALATLAFVLAAALTVSAMTRGPVPAQLGPCNVITLARLALTSALLAPLLAPGNTTLMLTLAILALLLDGADGWLARRFEHESAFGARFDMEVDAAFGLVLALNAAVHGTAGAAALLLGLPRYLFALAGYGWPWLNRALPARRGRKVVCVLQIIALIALQLPTLGAPVATAIVLGALATLTWSFGRDVIWLRSAGS